MWNICATKDHPFCFNSKEQKFYRPFSNNKNLIQKGGCTTKVQEVGHGGIADNLRL